MISKMHTYGFIHTIMSRIGLSNNDLYVLEKRNKKYKYISSKYIEFIDDNITWEKSEKSRNVWICILKGMKEATPLTVRCIDSIRKELKNWEIHIICEDNLHHFVSLPKYIIEKWYDGIISDTEISYMIANELLIQKGGLWIDKDILMTGQLPQYVYQRRFFLYTHTNPDDITVDYCAHVIYSEAFNPVLMQLQKLLFRYWGEEDEAIKPSSWHIFLTLIKESGFKFFDEIYYISDQIIEMMNRKCLDKFNRDYWESIKEISTIHKLSCNENFNDNVNQSYYHKIISGEI